MSLVRRGGAQAHQETAGADGGDVGGMVLSAGAQGGVRGLAPARRALPRLPPL